jgi:hypothetical protein
VTGCARAQTAAPPLTRSPSASSAGVWAGPADYRQARVIVKGQIITGVWAEHPDGLVAAIDVASNKTRQHDLAERL